MWTVVTTYPFISDDLIGSILGGVERGHCDVVFAVACIGYFGFEAGPRRRAARVAG